jgi:hypothetical protein
MSRPLGELIKDYEAEPANWELVRTQSVPSINRRNRGGVSIQELLRHKTTGEEMVRHVIVKQDGTLFAASHFRPNWK